MYGVTSKLFESKSCVRYRIKMIFICSVVDLKMKIKTHTLWTLVKINRINYNINSRSSPEVYGFNTRTRTNVLIILHLLPGSYLNER